MKLSLRARLLGRLVSGSSASRLGDGTTPPAPRPNPGHNPLTDLLLGRVAPGVDLRDASAGTAPIPIRIYRPQATGGALPAVVMIHGGGWSGGYLDAWDWLGSTIARDANAVVISLDYRLAPAHPWPAAVNDCFEALVDIVGRADELGIEPSRLTVLGDSAGGNLAAVIALMARDRGGPAIRLQVLIYPATDLTLRSRSMEENANGPIVTKQDMITYVDQYVGGGDRRHPHASPLFAADHAGLPPALIQVAEHDPLRDDGTRYASVLRSAGVPVRLTTYVGAPHGFLAFPYVFRTMAAQALAEICAEITEKAAAVS